MKEQPLHGEKNLNRAGAAFYPPISGHSGRLIYIRGPGWEGKGLQSSRLPYACPAIANI